MWKHPDRTEHAGELANVAGARVENERERPERDEQQLQEIILSLVKYCKDSSLDYGSERKLHLYCSPGDNEQGTDFSEHWAPYL